MAFSSLLRSAASYTVAAPRPDFFSSPASDHSKVRDDVLPLIDVMLDMFSFVSDSLAFLFDLICF